MTLGSLLTASTLVANAQSKVVTSEPAKAEPVPLDKTTEIAKLQALLKQTEFLAVEFEQEIFRSLRPNNKRISRGYALFAKPSRFVWTQKDPIKEELIYDGKVLVQYKPDAKVATRFKDGSNMRLREVEEVVAMVLQPESLLNRYEPKEVNTSKDSAEVVLQPRQQGDLVSVTLRISLDRRIVDHVKLQYSNGNYWAVKFSNPSTSRIDDAKFTFTADKGVNVTDL